MVWSLPAWGVWIEIARLSAENVMSMSLPAWGVWIEMSKVLIRSILLAVAPRMGSVD